MSIEKENVLMLTRTMGLGGTENVILQLCEALNGKVNKIIVCSCGGVNVTKLNSMGIRHYLIPDIVEKKPFTFVKLVKEIKKIINKEKITIIHSHHRMAALYANICSNNKIKKIATAHNTFFDKKILTKIAYKDTNIIAVGTKVKENLVGYYHIKRDAVSVIHNSVKPYVHTESIVEYIEDEKKAGNILVGNIGRLSRQKGMEYYLESIPYILKKNNRVRFVIVGDGEDRKKLEIQASNYINNGILKFLGYRSDVQDVMKQLDIIVLSSLWEGFPLTPIEAYSVGKTIVATDVDGTPEIVKNNVNGILVQPESYQEIADAVIKLIDNSDFRKKLESNAYITFNKEFCFDKWCDKCICYYESLD